MEWAVEVEDMTVAYTTKPVLWDGYEGPHRFLSGHRRPEWGR